MTCGPRAAPPTLWLIRDAIRLHVNTLRYRIGRIEELTGRDLSKLEDRVDFYLALELS